MTVHGAQKNRRSFVRASLFVYVLKMKEHGMLPSFRLFFVILSDACGAMMYKNLDFKQNSN